MKLMAAGKDQRKVMSPVGRELNGFHLGDRCASAGWQQLMQIHPEQLDTTVSQERVGDGEDLEPRRRM
jgi:hypothetical protein